MAIPTFGPNAVDWEQRVDLARLRDERLARLRAELERSDLGAAAELRLRQHPLHDRDPHRHLGHGQADPVRPAAARRGAGGLGLRLGRPAPPAVQPVARPHRRPGHARRERPGPAARAGISTLRGAFHPDAGIAAGLARQDRGRAARATAWPASRSGWTWPRCRCWPRWRPRASGPSTGSRCSWRPGGPRPATRSRCSARPAPWSTPPTPSCTSSSGRACARTSASAWSARSSTTWAASTWRGSTRSPASAARRTRTCTPTG